MQLRLGLALSLALCLLASRAWADDAAEARARFDEGVIAYDRGDHEAARAKFLQAYALRRHPDVLFNLGWSCLRAGRRDEAARHFRRYLDEARPTPERRAIAERGLREARAGGAVGTTTTTAAEVPAATTPPSRTSGVTASALLGVSSHLLNIGLGARGGTTLPSRLYAGGAFVYNVGASTTATSGGYRADATTSAWYLGPEVGYDLALGSFIVRPYAGLGLATLSATATGPGGVSASASHAEIVLWPGAMSSYDVAGTAFVVGADFHLLTIPGGPATCLFATGGARF